MVAKPEKISHSVGVKDRNTFAIATRQAAEQVGTMVDKGKEQMNQYVGRGREVVDRGRAQWEDFVERGKNLVSDQTSRVGAAVDAGREAYRSTSSEGL